MVRRFNNSVHKQVSRLMRGGFPMREPAWYQAVLDHPPLPLPARAPPKRTAFDSHWSSFHENPHQRRPLPIYYLEDRVRKQFFEDHPFETFRPRTLVEGEKVEEEHPVRDGKWTRLRERGRNPSPEDAIQFAVTLYNHHGVSLSNAYKTAVAQFRALRAEHHLMTAYAAQEAEAQGAVFGPTPITAGFEAETAVMAQNVEIKARADQSDVIARKRWRMVVPPGGPQGEWSRGQEYVQLWRAGVRPNYEALTTPLNADPLAALEQQKMQIDRMTMQRA